MVFNLRQIKHHGVHCFKWNITIFFFFFFLQMSEVEKQGCPVHSSPYNDPQGLIPATSLGWGEKKPSADPWKRGPYHLLFQIQIFTWVCVVIPSTSILELGPSIISFTLIFKSRLPFHSFLSQISPSYPNYRILFSFQLKHILLSFIDKCLEI